jgi:maltose/moltooligosaccharide transporter
MPIRSDKPRLSLARIVSMNLGFLGLQFSFGLQQSNMGPIYRYLGADEATLPLLWLAGPMTGLLIQPIIGAMSDRTVSRLGRRTPYFLIGAMLCSLCLFAMPYSRALWIAASLLWVLDAANNVTMEPYRAYVSDRLAPEQRSLGFLTQSAFTGLAQTLSYLAPSLLVWAGMSADALDANGIPVVTRIAFVAGAVISLSTILWSIVRVPELPLTEVERAEIARAPLSAPQALADLKAAIVEMPTPMRQLAVAMLFQWYAMFAYWQFIAFAIARSLFHTADAATPGFRAAVLVAGQVGGFYNFVAFVGAFAMVPFAKAFGAKRVHSVCLVASGVAMLAIPGCTSEATLFIPMVGIGLGWAGMMGNPYIMLANSIPPSRTGIYMGIFNMFIVIPMLIESVTMPLLYPLLGRDPRGVLVVAGTMMLAAAAATMLVRAPRLVTASS